MPSKERYQFKIAIRRALNNFDPELEANVTEIDHKPITN